MVHTSHSRGMMLLSSDFTWLPGIVIVIVLLLKKKVGKSLKICAKTQSRKEAKSSSFRSVSLWDSEIFEIRIHIKKTEKIMLINKDKKITQDLGQEHQREMSNSMWFFCRRENNECSGRKWGFAVQWIMCNTSLWPLLIVGIVCKWRHLCKFFFFFCKAVVIFYSRSWRWGNEINRRK